MWTHTFHLSQNGLAAGCTGCGSDVLHQTDCPFLWTAYASNLFYLQSDVVLHAVSWGWGGKGLFPVIRCQGVADAEYTDGRRWSVLTMACSGVHQRTYQSTVARMLYAIRSLVALRQVVAESILLRNPTDVTTRVPRTFLNNSICNSTGFSTNLDIVFESIAVTTNQTQTNNSEVLYILYLKKPWRM